MFNLRIMMLSFLLLIAAAGGVSARNTMNTLSVRNGDDWGDWGYEDYCVEGTYAIGYDMKIEEWQGNGDDTALNGIRLICQSQDGHANRHGSATSETGPWGNWVGQALCDSRGGEQNFLKSFRLQVESWQGRGDDTSANFVKFQCRDLNNRLPSYELSKDPGYGRWGTYGGWSSECPSGQAICGIKTRTEVPQRGGDDTALNDVVFMCCY